MGVSHELTASELPRSVPPDVSAREAGLRYVTDQIPGISRVLRKTGFQYIDPGGRPVRDQEALQRIRSLVIPPGWGSVWICPFPKGHLQVTARDSKGRKQYRYHPLYRSVREKTKYERMVLFGELLPKIRQRLHQDLSRQGLPKEKVLAAVVRIMDLAHIRVGNEEYVRQNHSYGLTTMRDQHVQIEGSRSRFRFRGKSGKMADFEIDDRRLTSIIARCRDLPGYELFQYLNDAGEPESIDSAMVNDYLREITGEDITAKDFRTWHGTIHAAVQLAVCGPCSGETEIKRQVVNAVKSVAERLGNRPATCRKHYIHPFILEAYASGILLDAMNTTEHEPETLALNPAERCVLKLLRRPRGAEEAPKQKPARKGATRKTGASSRKAA
jgi:DNA topoisomerase-1